MRKKTRMDLTLQKGDVGNAIEIHRAKLLQQFSPHPMDQQVYSCCHNFLTVTQSYSSKITPISKFHAVKLVKAVFLYVFTMAFPTSLLCHLRQLLGIPLQTEVSTTPGRLKWVFCTFLVLNCVITANVRTTFFNQRSQRPPEVGCFETSQTHRQKDGHGDSMTDPAQGA